VTLWYRPSVRTRTQLRTSPQPDQRRKRPLRLGDGPGRHLGNSHAQVDSGRRAARTSVRGCGAVVFVCQASSTAEAVASPRSTSRWPSECRMMKADAVSIGAGGQDPTLQVQADGWIGVRVVSGRECDPTAGAMTPRSGHDVVDVARVEGRTSPLIRRGVGQTGDQSPRTEANEEGLPRPQ
jgi:hypothetical protein